jgi:hypothetical protein
MQNDTRVENSSRLPEPTPPYPGEGFLPSQEVWQETPQMILQLHLAEYQALTMRLTYWITLQYTAGFATATLLLSLVAVRSFIPIALFYWAAACIVLGFIAAYYYTIYEMMNNALYIESEIAAPLRHRLPDAVFWQYERYRTRNKVYSPSGLYIPMIWCFAVFILAVWLRWPPLSVVDWVGGAAGVLLTCWCFIIARLACQTQERLWKVATKPRDRTTGFPATNSRESSAGS